MSTLTEATVTSPAYQRGFEDGRDGKDSSACPYRGVTDGSKILRARWLEGFSAGASLREKRLKRRPTLSRVKSEHTKQRLAEIEMEQGANGAHS